MPRVVDAHHEVGRILEQTVLPGLLGDTTRLSLTLFGSCGFIERPADIVLAVNTFGAVHSVTQSRLVEAGDLAGKVIPPGPDDPIKARWMGIFDGAGIHGTTDTASLGSAARAIAAGDAATAD